jgi:hypothetical protein
MQLKFGHNLMKVHYHLFFLNREPWGKAPRQNATILNKKGNKYLQQAQQEVRQTENGERGQKAKRPKGQKS